MLREKKQIEIFSIKLFDIDSISLNSLMKTFNHESTAGRGIWFNQTTLKLRL